MSYLFTTLGKNSFAFSGARAETEVTGSLSFVLFWLFTLKYKIYGLKVLWDFR